MPRKITHDDYVNELKEKNPHIKILGKYTKAKDIVKHYCELHDYVWDALPTNILKGCGCPICRKEKIGNKLKKTHSEYIKELEDKKNNIIVLDHYIDALTPIKHKCSICNYEWMVTPANILYGKSCPRCINNIRKTTEEYKKELLFINPNIIVLEDYISRKTPILHKCLIHDIEWTTTPASILQGCGCKECARDKLISSSKKTHEEYVNELKFLKPTIIPLDNYLNSLTPIRHKCLIDNFEWYASPANILYSTGCPKCNRSHGEDEISRYLDNKDIAYIPQKRFKDCKDKKALPFDFYLPTYNVCIEYDGEQHSKPIDFFGGEKSFQLLKRHDEIKTNYCKEHNIKLLRITPKQNNFLFI